MASKLTARFPAGSRVRIAGLVAAAHLNSRLDTAVRPTRPLAAGQIVVRIDGWPKSWPKMTSGSWATVGPDVAANA